MPNTFLVNSLTTPVDLLKAQLDSAIEHDMRKAAVHKRLVTIMADRSFRDLFDEKNPHGLKESFCTIESLILLNDQEITSVLSQEALLFIGRINKINSQRDRCIASFTVNLLPLLGMCGVDASNAGLALALHYLSDENSEHTKVHLFQQVIAALQEHALYAQHALNLLDALDVMTPALRHKFARCVAPEINLSYFIREQLYDRCLLFRNNKHLNKQYQALARYLERNGLELFITPDESITPFTLFALSMTNSKQVNQRIMRKLACIDFEDKTLTLDHKDIQDIRKLITQLSRFAYSVRLSPPQVKMKFSTTIANLAKYLLQASDAKYSFWRNQSEPVAVKLSKNYSKAVAYISITFCDGEYQICSPGSTVGIIRLSNADDLSTSLAHYLTTMLVGNLDTGLNVEVYADYAPVELTRSITPVASRTDIAALEDTTIPRALSASGRLELHSFSEYRRSSSNSYLAAEQDNIPKKPAKPATVLPEVFPKLPRVGPQNIIQL